MILGVVLGSAGMLGRAVAGRASERSAVNTFQQAVWQGATMAAARGFRTELVRDGDELLIRNLGSGAVLRRFDIDPKVVTNLGTAQLLVFTPPGTIVTATLEALPQPVTFTAAGSVYELEVSLIGEVRVR